MVMSQPQSKQRLRPYRYKFWSIHDCLVGKLMYTYACKSDALTSYHRDFSISESIYSIMKPILTSVVRFGIMKSE